MDAICGHALSQEILTGIINALPDSMALLEFDGNILYVNNAWAKFAASNGGNPSLMGPSVNYLEVCKAAIPIEYGEQSDAGRAYRGISDVCSGQQDTYELKYPCHTKDRHMWFLLRATRIESADLRLVLVSHVDVTAESQADITKIETEALYQSLFKNMMDEVHYWELVRDSSGNIQNWRLVDINPITELSWGKTREDVIGKTADEIFSSSAVELFMPIVTKIFKERKPHSWETYFPDMGQHLKMTSVPFGEYFISTGMDITQIKQALDAAEQANEVKSEFLAAMSHELRTPLNAILGYSQMLQMGVYGELGPKQKEMTDNIVVGGNHLLRLVDDVLDLARIESNQLNLNIETFEANEVINECLRWISDKCAKRKILIDNAFGSGQAYIVKSDKVRMAQVITNLFSNAEKYNVDGGMITIGGVVTENGYLRLSVSDTGVGIKTGAGLRIFDLFDRGITDPEVAGGGVGIGLAVSRNIIERLGGWIDYKSTVGVGSEFWITVPLSDNDDVLIWTDDLRVGIDEIDKDHQRIFVLTNHASRTSLDDIQVGEIIEQMIAYTRYHFKREETIMQVVDYPNFDEHCVGHRKLEAQVESLASSWRNHPSVETRRELQHFLRDWWRGHIMARDVSITHHAVGKEIAIREALISNGLKTPPWSYS